MNRFHKNIFPILLFAYCILPTAYSFAQTDTTRHSIYDRPFVLKFGKTASVGGYFEGNTNYFVEQGVTDGFSMEARRFNIFLYSSISDKIKFFSELEFEHGTEEIALETAILDFTFHPALNFRGGIILSPLGKFNIEHDSPKYNIIDRPLASTQIIPATLSEIGFGFYGQHYLNVKNRFGYEIYLVNGLSDGIINNSEGATRIAEGKSIETFEEDNNGIPSFVGRMSWKNNFLGELGVSHYAGIYNTFRKEGIIIDEKRSLRISAVDYNKMYKNFRLRGELAFSKIEVPENLKELFAEKQWGFYADAEYTYLKRKIFGFENAKLIAVLRADKTDLNVGTFSSTGTTIGDETFRLSIGHAFRPVENTVFKIVYHYDWFRDFFGNPVHAAGFQAGIATYF